MSGLVPRVLGRHARHMTRGWGRSILKFVYRHGTNYLFVLPYFVHFLVYWAFPIVFSTALSLTDWTLSSPRRSFIGLANYRRLLLADEVFLQSTINTLYFMVFRAAGVVVLGFGMAILLNAKLHGIRLFRTVFYFPVVVDMVIVSLVWLWLLDPNIGFINQFLLAHDYQPQPFLHSSTQAMPVIIVMSIWKGVAYYAVLFLAGLQDVPKVLIEAAQIDGASRWQTLRYVTLPWLAPVTMFVIIIASIRSLRVFTQVYVMTKGGPLNATITVMVYLYNQAFRYFEMGYGSAIAVVWCITVMVLVLIQHKVLGTRGRTTG